LYVYDGAQLPNLPPGTELWIKRDDLSGMQLSGNKVSRQ
jgi:1-aminocyclopropane-1-carboxylate deaminase/D-cysteine desulfhydrase-like pyridoxal-dependent ACC family enzyme